MTMTLQRISKNETSVDSILCAGGIGAMETKAGNLPLKQVQVRSSVDGIYCRTAITQRFHNTHSEFVEATYIFPLPGRFAVTECQMHLKGHTITAELKERAEARADYDRAIQEGKSASIVEEERSETFSLRVGNIPPGEEISVELTLVGCLTVVGSEATMRIPLVVAPRYISGDPIPGPQVGKGTSADTDEVPDASRISPPVLLPGFPNPVELSVEVSVSNPFALQKDWHKQIQSSLHSVLVSEGESYLIKLQPGERLNRDFILRFPILNEQLQTCVQFETDSKAKMSDGTTDKNSKTDDQQTFAITILPPKESPDSTKPCDVVFVLDRSGSMSGWKIAAARRAVARMIDSLGENDRFSAMAFDNGVEFFDKEEIRFYPASDQNRWSAAEWIAKIDSRGGTELGNAMLMALRHFSSFGMPDSRESIVVLVTDGQVGGEDSVLRTIEQLRLPRLPRIFTMGIDRGVNSGLLQRLADMGEGCFEQVESEERLDQVMQRFHETINAPVLSDVKIEEIGGELVLNSISPNRSVSVFSQRPLTVYARARSNGSSIRARVTGKLADGMAWEREITSEEVNTKMLLPLWGRARIRDLEDEYAKGTGDSSRIQKEIVEVSLSTNVLSRFTSYVAIDSEIVNQGGKQHEILQPVEMPEDWDDDILAQLCEPYMRVRRHSGFNVARKSASPEAPGRLLEDSASGAIFGSVFDSAFDESFDDESADSMLQEFRGDDFDFLDLAFERDQLRGDDKPSINRFVVSLFAEAIAVGATHAILIRSVESVKGYFIVTGKLVEYINLMSDSESESFAGQINLKWNHGTISADVDGIERSAKLYVEPPTTGSFAIVLSFSDAPALPTGRPEIDQLMEKVEEIA